MPATRPEAISNRIRLTYEGAGSVRAFVSEYGAIDSVLSAVIDELSPHEEGVSCAGAEYNFLAGPHEQFCVPPICIDVSRIVALI